MRDSVKSGRGCHLERLRNGKTGIKESNPKSRLGIATGHFDMGARVRDERVRLGLAARSGRGGNANHR